MAARVISDANGRAMAEQARAIAAGCQPSPFFRMAPDYDPEAALDALAIARIRQERRLVSDKLALLAENGKVSAVEWRAAQEMRHIAEFTEGGRMPLVRSQLRERLPAGGDGTGELLATEELARLYYLPWRRYARHYPVRGSATLEDLWRAVGLNGKGIRQAANYFQIDQRRCLRLVRRGCGHYAGLRGWAQASAELC